MMEIAQRAGLVDKIRAKLAILRENSNLMDAATVFTVRVLAAFMAYGVQIFLARSLNLTEYGIYVTLWTWMIIANHAACFGFGDTALRFIPRYHERKKGAWVRGFLKTGYKTALACSIVFGAVGLAALHLLEDFVAPGYFIPLMVFMIGMPFTVIELYLGGVSRSFGWFLLTVVPSYVVRPLLIAAGVYAALLLGHEPDASMVLGIAIVITAVLSVVMTLIVRHRVRKLYGNVPSAGSPKFWISVSFPILIINVVDEVFLWSDILILGILAQPEDVSIYFAAHRSMALAAFVQFAFMIVVARDLSIANAQRDKAELQRRVSKASFWTFWLTIPAVTITLIAGYPLLSMFGPEFRDGYVIMLVLGLGYVVRAYTGQAQDLLIVLGHQRSNLTISISAIVLNVIAALIFIPEYGILGAAISTTLIYAVRSIIYIIVLKRIANVWVPAGIPGLYKPG